MAKITVKQIVSVLQEVPEKTFRITGLVGQIIDEKGKVDILKAMDQQGELNLAIAEVESYIKGNRVMLESLFLIKKAKPEEVDAEMEDEE